MAKEQGQFLTRIKGLQTPKPFSSRSRVETFYLSNESLPDLERRKLEKIVQVLEHPGLQKLIDRGEITYGMIKPKVNEGKDLPLNDDEAAKTIAEEIGEENVIFALPLQFTEPQVKEFYSHLKTTLKPEIFEGIIDFMTSGPVTAVLIQHRDEQGKGDAVTWWRNKMGPTKPQEGHEGQIRFDHAKSINNNIVHGSDSPESVKREIAIIRKGLKEIVLKNQEAAA